MAASKKTKVLSIEHTESGHKEELSQEEWDGIQPAIQAKYKITDSREISTPVELNELSAK